MVSMPPAPALNSAFWPTAFLAVLVVAIILIFVAEHDPSAATALAEIATAYFTWRAAIDAGGSPRRGEPHPE